MRGEQIVLETACSCRVGSSPHAWGTDVLKELNCFSSRFIPTCVGNRWYLGVRCPKRPVHPHMRGEQPVEFPTTPAMSGSSPHAWGTDVLKELNCFSSRFIPTCVGNSCQFSGALDANSFHPHMRGEQFSPLNPSNEGYGSSPHAWGTGFIGWVQVLPDRFIPTCVGNSGSSWQTDSG